MAIHIPVREGPPNPSQGAVAEATQPFTQKVVSLSTLQFGMVGGLQLGHCAQAGGFWNENRTSKQMNWHMVREEII